MSIDLVKYFRNNWNAYREGVSVILPLYRLDETRDVCVTVLDLIHSSV